ncbi:MAG: hypothetical protein CMM60_13165 [Rhodospirillaceae bacterium]|jgi:hypothetical protein|nr:hypothetical protein [Rhodospirillaceae bacterium]
MLRDGRLGGLLSMRRVVKPKDFLILRGSKTRLEGEEIRSHAICDSPGPIRGRAAGLLASKPNKLVAVAMANKAARVAWVVMTRGEVYRAHRPATEGTA